jgi:coproporphyrinogen III oxidase
VSKDLEPVVKQLQNASKMHAAQAKIVKNHIKTMHNASKKKSKDSIIKTHGNSKKSKKS